MKSTSVIAVALMLTAAVWTIIASFILCKMANQTDMFLPPWDQWWYSLWWFGLNWWSTIIVIVSALVPTVLLALPWTSAVSFSRGRRRRPSLYGKTGFAEPQQMRRTGMALRKDLFPK